MSDLAALRREFPALEVRVRGRRLAYLDSAATALKPRAVIDAVTRVATHEAGNPHRAVHALAEAATVELDRARTDVAGLIGADAREVVFTSGTTASINLVAQTWGRANVGAGDVVLVTALEHHSNLVPWQMLCAERGAILRAIPVDDAGRLDLSELDALLDGRVRLVAIAHVSNVVGTVAPIAELARRAHAAGAVVVVDGAQAIAHQDVDVGALGCDFYAFSAHKLYGPPGVGVLWGRASILAGMPPWQGGGEMIASVELASSTYREPPYRFEAGTPNISGVIGTGAAIRWLRAQDRAAIAAREARLHARLVDVLAAAGARVIGRPERAVVAFEVPGVHPHDVATIADGEGVALRSGHHCAQPLHRRFGLDASTRASLGCYSGDDDVDQLGVALVKVREVLA